MEIRDRQADATDDATRARLGAAGRGIAIAALVAAALFSVAVEVLYLPFYVGGSWTPDAAPADLAQAAGGQLAAPLGSGAIPVPVTALIAAVLNIALVAAMRTLTDSLRLALLPVVAWAFGFLLCTFPGPGSDTLLMGDWPTLLLLVCGTVPPLLYAFNVNTAVAPPAPVPTRR
ncbi:hypothetical protein IU449_12345 [Nocardia higoensis]|uniref:Uncharacterized protein n=1 Tax=Nocardia higoensis TaxID=228599 RepID=A0ABS0DA47_9NOCA|nr:hypothetical protein [Nocardia higoensis]MBF6355324.1 hypothetical protein [Nocardia higoensis]